MVVGCYIMKTNFKTHLGILMVTFPKHQYLYQYFLQKLSVLKVNAFATGLRVECTCVCPNLFSTGVGNKKFQQVETTQ